MGVGYKRGEGDRVEKQWKLLRKVERNTDKCQDVQTWGRGWGAKIHLAEEQSKSSKTNLTEITRDLEAKMLSKKGPVTTDIFNFVSETKPVRHYSKKNYTKINTTEAVKSVQQGKKRRGNTDEMFGPSYCLNK